MISRPSRSRRTRGVVLYPATCSHPAASVSRAWCRCHSQQNCPQKNPGQSLSFLISEATEQPLSRNRAVTNFVPDNASQRSYNGPRNDACGSLHLLSGLAKERRLLEPEKLGTERGGVGRGGIRPACPASRLLLQPRPPFVSHHLEQDHRMQSEEWSGGSQAIPRLAAIDCQFKPSVASIQPATQRGCWRPFKGTRLRAKCHRSLALHTIAALCVQEDGRHHVRLRTTQTTTPGELRGERRSRVGLPLQPLHLRASPWRHHQPMMP